MHKEQCLHLIHFTGVILDTNGPVAPFLAAASLSIEGHMGDPGQTVTNCLSWRSIF